MTILKKEKRKPAKKQQNQDSSGADAAMLRAAKRACRRAIETAGSVAVFRDGKIVQETDIRKIFPEGAEID